MRRFAVLLIMALFLFGALPGPGSAVAENEVSGRQPVAEISVHQFSEGPVTVFVLLPEGAETAEVRYWPFSAESGLYANGEGESAGARADVSVPEGQNKVAAVALKEPGKYTLCGIPFYVLSPEDEAPSALAREILAAVDKAESSTQKATAEKLYTWLLKRVKNTIPADREDLQAACTDPFNCLLTGYALPESYPSLYQLLLRCAGIRSVPVYGTAKEEDHTWLIFRPDGQWLYADPALDDVKDRADKKYFALDEKKLEKDHTLSEPSRRLVKERITGTTLEAFHAGDYAILDEMFAGGETHPMNGIEGKWYGLCPTEPVTIRRYIPAQANAVDYDWGPEINVLAALGNYMPWDPEFQRFLMSDGTWKTVPKDAYEVLDYAPDYSTITIRFLIPGAYGINNTGNIYYALDPNDEAQAKVAARLDEALESCRRDTQTETAKALHDWERKVLSYDHASYNKQMRNGGIAEYDDCAQCPIAGILRGKAVCGGYTNLYNLLLNSAGIPCYGVVGRNSTQAQVEHGWNLQRLDGTWSYTDVTWDDDKGTDRYFAKSLNDLLKDHIPEGSGKDFFDTWAENRIYDRQLFLFFRDWGPKNTVPQSLRPFPATAKECGFPAKVPNFYKIKVTRGEDGFYSLQNPGRSVTCFRMDLLNSRGKRMRIAGYNPEGIRQFPRQFWQLPNEIPKIYRLTLQDYQEDIIPLNKASIRQEADWVNGELEIGRAEYHYQVPLKKNEIKGFGEGSRKIYTYSMDLKPIACTWHLAAETQTLDITLYFDENGSTVRYRVSRTPEGGEPVIWEAEKDGTVTYVGYGKNGVLQDIDDVTDVYSNPMYRLIRDSYEKRYKTPEGEPPAEGVRVYALRKDAEEIYAGSVVYGMNEPIFRWNELGQLEFTPDLTDIAGNPLSFSEFTPDLSICERLEIR